MWPGGFGRLDGRRPADDWHSGERSRADVMIAQTIRTFDRWPVPTRSAVAVAGPGSKQRGGLSDYITEFDPFAGVFTLFLHLVLLTVLFVLQLGIDRRPPAPPIVMAVVLVPEPIPEPVILPPAP